VSQFILLELEKEKQMPSDREKLARAVGIITICMIFSRILGYMRDAMLYAQFSQGRLADIYNAAFSIPDFIYNILVGGALSSAFIPVFSRYLAKNQDDDAWLMASNLFNVMMILLSLFIGLAVLFTPQLVQILVPGFKKNDLALTVKLTRIMFIQTVLMGLSGVTVSILNSYKRFTSAALGSVFYNAAIVVVGAIFGPRLGIEAFSIGVVVGAGLNLLIQIPEMMHVGLRYKPLIDLGNPGLRQVGKLVVPVVLGLSFAQFNLFVAQNMASGLPGGDLAALRTAQRLMQIPLGIFAVAIGTAVFPTMTEQVARNEWGPFRRTTSLGVRLTNYLTIPCAIGLVAIGMPMVRLLFQFGHFNAHNTWATASALKYYSFGIIGYSGALILTRAFYALQDTVTPVIVGIATVFFNRGLDLILIGPLGHRGLALGYSLVGVINMLVLLIWLRVKSGQVDGKKMIVSGAGATLAAAVMGIAGYLVLNKLQMALGVASKLAQFEAVGVTLAVSVLIYFLLSYLLKLEEFTMSVGILGRRLGIKRGAE
jgi:putative peptidoglycan lipid II flippase